MQKTTFPVEILIHDDASTDDTAMIVREYELKYPHLIKPIYQTENQYSKQEGVIGRLQRGRARGKYYAICEGDDYWIDPFKLQKQVEFLEDNPEYSLIWSDVDKLHHTTGIIENNSLSKIPIKNTLNDFLVKAWFVATCTWVYRTEFFDDNLIKYPFRESYSVGDLRILLIALDHGKITKFPEKNSTAVYRVLDESASHFRSFKKIFDFQKGVLQIQLDFAKYFKVTNSIKFLIICQYLIALFKRLLVEILYRIRN
jgi:glycosyltransferase involved in cell wall biosynthesis